MSSPRTFLGRVGRHLEYVACLLDGRKTIAEHRRLLVVAGGWLSLLGATCHIDLRQYPAALNVATPRHPARGDGAN
ncbi:hypothetical protein [Nonomuraea purpurea]|uniref:hypothetical protein n=1 Tax=Nonomuraea purpurea TaxID=1849276 RepID=UPI0036D21104